MDMVAFRELCENANASNTNIVAAIMAAKRAAALTDAERDAICAILTETNRPKLAMKFSRNRQRHRPHAP